METDATVRNADPFEKELVCPVCLSLYNRPVTLECGHNFCKSCISAVLRERTHASCPQCRRRLLGRKYTVNRTLEAITARWRNSVDRVISLSGQDLNTNIYTNDDADEYGLSCLPEKDFKRNVCAYDDVTSVEECLANAVISEENECCEKETMQKSSSPDVKETTMDFQSTIKFKFATVQQHLMQICKLLSYTEEQVMQQLGGDNAGIRTAIQEHLHNIKIKSSEIDKEVCDMWSALAVCNSLFLHKETASPTEESFEKLKTNTDSGSALMSSAPSQESRSQQCCSPNKEIDIKMLFNSSAVKKSSAEWKSNPCVTSCIKNKMATQPM